MSYLIVLVLAGSMLFLMLIFAVLAGIGQAVGWVKEVDGLAMTTGDLLLDLQQWLIDLLAQDIGRLTMGLIGVLIVVEFLVSFKEWIS